MKKIILFLLFSFFGAWVFGQEEKPAMVVQMGHTDQVNSVAFTPDGEYVLSGSEDRTMKLWHIASGREIRIFTGHSDSVTSVAVSSGGEYALSGSLDGSMKLWEIATGKLLYSFFPGSSDMIFTVAFSPDDKLVIAGTCNRRWGGGRGRLIVWDKATKKRLKVFDGHTDLVTSVDFSPNGKFILSGSRDKTMKLWDMDQNKEIRTFTGHTSWVNSVSFSPDGKFVLSGSSDYTIKLWDITSGRNIRTFSGTVSGVVSADFSSNGEYILSAGYDHTLRLWDAAAGKEVRKFSGHSDRILSAVFSPDGKYAVTADEDKILKVWNIESGREIRTFSECNTNIDSIDISKDEKFAFSGTWDGTARLWNLNKLSIIHTFTGHSDRVHSVALSPDGINAASSSVDGTVKLWDIQEKREVRTISDFESTVWEPLVDFSPDGRYLLYVQKRLIQISDLLNPNNPSRIIKQNNYLRDAVFSQDGEYILAGNEDGTMKLWDIDTGQNKRTFKGHAGFVQSVAFSLDGKYILSGSNDRTVKLWDASEGNVIQTLKGHSDFILAVALSPDMKYAASGDMDCNLMIWDIETGKLFRRFTGHRRCISSVSFLSKGKSVLSGAWDGTMRIWNIETGDWVAFTANTDGSEWLIFDSDGYWDASPNGGEMVAMVRGMECWNIDQFAVRNNRPDLILKKLPAPDPELIEHYHNQYLRRLRRLGLVEEDLSEDYHVPSAEIVESRQEGKYIDLRFVLEDDRVPLKSYNIYVNDVPVFGAYGRELDDAAAGGRTALHERIELSAGENKIELSCMNEAGAEAFRPVVYAAYDGPVERDLYYIGFGVSEYRDESLDLRYAHKDAEDLGKLFESLTVGSFAPDSPTVGSHGPPRTGSGNGEGAYRRVITRTYTDEEVIRKNIAAAKSLLEQASVDDTVVLMISGHGVHDRDEYATYYYLTHETDLDNLAQTAVEFEELEELLQGIPPRRKLFLMDTCGSGEWEPIMIQKIVSSDSKNKGVRARIPEDISSSIVEYTGRDFTTAGESRTYLSDKDRYIYNDLLRRSGAIVFSSCRGDEVSYETSKYTNGIFTEYILRAFSPSVGSAKAGDTNGDGTVSIEELRKYVIEGVSEETKSNPLLYPVPQNPTVDRDNIYMEFGF